MYEHRYAADMALLALSPSARRTKDLRLPQGVGF
jgi:hypothetical protein